MQADEQRQANHQPSVKEVSLASIREQYVILMVYTQSTDFPSRFAKSPVWKCVVGPEKSEYNVHESLLVRTSRVFAVMTKEEWRRQNLEVDYTDIEDSGFKEFVYWLYHGRLSVTVLISIGMASRFSRVCHSRSIDSARHEGFDCSDCFTWHIFNRKLLVVAACERSRRA